MFKKEDLTIFLVAMGLSGVFFAIMSSFSPPQTATMSLSTTASVKTPPDQMTADFTLQATAPSAAAAQMMLNAVAAKALARAKTLQHVVATTSDYTVQQVDQTQPNAPVSFQATQDMTLVAPLVGGEPDTAFLTTIGDLQTLGLQLQGLQGTLSLAGQAAATQEATDLALADLKTESAQAAKTVNAKSVTISSLQIGDQPQPLPLPHPMMMLAAQAPIAPTAAPGSVETDATVSGVFLLETK